MKKGGPIYQFWSILLHPQEEGVPSKTQQWDEALTLDLAYHSYLGPAMDRHLRLRSRSRSSKAFTVEMKEVNDFMLDRWKHHNLQVLKKPHLYRLRHGGASHELGGKLRTIQEVQIRGRWLCAKSPEELRESRTNGSTSRQSGRGKTTRMRASTRRNRQGPPRPALTVGRALTVMVFLEIFSGSGRLGSNTSNAWLGSFALGYPFWTGNMILPSVRISGKFLSGFVVVTLSVGIWVHLATVSQEQGINLEGHLPLEAISDHLGLMACDHTTNSRSNLETP